MLAEAQRVAVNRGSAEEVLRQRPDLIVTDVMMPDGNGIDMIPAIRKARPDLPVIVISAQNTIVTAIRATEAAAFDYLPKPFDLPDLMGRVRAGLERRIRREPAPAASSSSAPVVPEGVSLIGHTPVMQGLFRSVARIVNTDLPVIVAGEPGTGRSTLAQALHDLGDRGEGPLVRLGASETAETLGTRLAQAQGGTLILEDPAGMEPAVQARLAGLIEAAESGPLKGLLAYTELPHASCDFNHDPHSAIVDGSQTRVSGPRLVNLLAWFDNEWGFANRMLDVAEHFLHVVHPTRNKQP